MKKYIQIILILTIMFIGVFILASCNKQIIDTTYHYDKAITYIGNERIEIEIKKWKDYDGEQIQIVAEDGTVYLLSMNNTILIEE